MSNVSMIDGHIDEPKKITRFEKIKDMTLEELATFIDEIQTDALFLEGTVNDLSYPCSQENWTKWLEREIEE